MKPTYEELEAKCQLQQDKLDAINKLMGVIESASDLAKDGIANLEQQLSESRREFTAANATIHNLELKVAQLVAENARLNNFISKSCYVRAGEDSSWHPAIDHSPETPVTNQLSVEESQFLTEVITAAGLLSCGKQDKGLARRITDFCVAKRGNSIPAQLRQGAEHE